MCIWWICVKYFQYPIALCCQWSYTKSSLLWYIQIFQVLFHQSIMIHLMHCVYRRVFKDCEVLCVFGRSFSKVLHCSFQTWKTKITVWWFWNSRAGKGIIFFIDRLEKLEFLKNIWNTFWWQLFFVSVCGLFFVHTLLGSNGVYYKV